MYLTMSHTVCSPVKKRQSYTYIIEIFMSLALTSILINITVLKLKRRKNLKNFKKRKVNSLDVKNMFKLIIH